MIKVDVDDRYTFIVQDDGSIEILRFHQPWMHSMCNGDGNVFPSKAIMALIYKCEQQESRIKELESTMINSAKQIKELAQEIQDVEATISEMD